MNAFGFVGYVWAGETGLSLVFFLCFCCFVLILDCFVPDPQRLWHPVQGIGMLLQLCERKIRRHVHSSTLLVVAGGMALLFVCAVVMLTVYCFLSIFSNTYIVFLFFLYFSWAGLALGSLLHMGKKGVKAFTQYSYGKTTLEELRVFVGMFVSRLTHTSKEADLRKSLAESLSENCTDGVFAPFFWLVFLGPVGLWGYKVASTMDSMWGYKTPQWFYLGTIGAKVDDICAFLAARLCALSLYCVVWFRLLPAQDFTILPSFSLFLQQAKSMESPNSGWSMAMAAWLCGSTMGGKTVYVDGIKDKPFLGSVEIYLQGQKIVTEKIEVFWGIENIVYLLRLLKYASFFGAFIVCIFLALVGFICN